MALGHVLAERARIAREIHDNVGHLLTRSVLQMEALAVTHEDDPALAEELAAVNIALPETREEFRAVLESLDKSSEAGQRATAAMLEVSEAFASITKSAAELAQVLRDEFSAAAAEAAKTLAALKTARQGIISVDKWLVTAGAGEQAYNDQRRGALWQMFDGGQLAAEQQLELLQELHLKNIMMKMI